MNHPNERILGIHRTYRRVLISIGCFLALGWATYGLAASLTNPGTFQAGQTITAQAMNDRFGALYDGHNDQETRIETLENAPAATVETFKASGTATGSTNTAVYYVDAVTESNLGALLSIAPNPVANGTIFVAQAPCLVHATVSFVDGGGNTSAGAVIGVNPSGSFKTRSSGALYNDSSVEGFAYHNIGTGTTWHNVSASLPLSAGDELVFAKAYGENQFQSVLVRLTAEVL